MKVYISGVGVGMGPIAFMARDMGFEVVLSNQNENDLVDHMRRSGFTVHIGQDGSSIESEHNEKAIDWFIYTSALPEKHPELEFVANNSIKSTKRDGFINYLLSEKDLKMIAVAGTHGKTNSTAILAWVFQQFNIPISYSIGTLLSFSEFGKYDPKSKYFIYEADEFDRNFLNYYPDISIVTNIAYDHPDTYPDQMDYDQAFAQFIAQSRSVYIYSDDLNSSHEHIHSIDKNLHEDSTKLAGLYIRQNARLAIEMLVNEFGLERDEVINHINDYPGSERRMEKISKNIYSDYAHHPDEIKATINAASEINPNVVVVYQPHQNLRQHEIIDTYTDCFEGASKIYWLPTYLSREPKDLDILNPDQLIEGLSNKQIALIAEMNPELAENIRNDADDGSIVVAMSAGDLDHWIRQNFGK